MTSLAARHSVQRVEREIIYLLICLFKHLLMILGQFLQKSRYLWGPEKLSYVCPVCILDQSFNNFENTTM